MSDNPNIFYCTVWRVLEDKTISEAVVVKIIYVPDTDSFNLLLDQEQMDEFIDAWLRAEDVNWRTSNTAS